MRFRLSAAAAVLFLSLGVIELEAQQPPPTPPTQEPKKEQEARKRRGDRSKLTRQDLDEAGSIATAQDAIRMLRPHWLQPPVGRMASSNMTSGGGGATTVILYVDGTRQVDLEVLKTVSNAEIHEMRYLDQNRAIGIHGPGHEAGVIEIVTVKKKP